MTDLLEDSRAYWDRHAQRDPLWAVLSDAAKRGGKWDVGRFFQSGTSEIGFFLYELDAQQFVLRHGSALDFGCGVGRLTQALAPHFDRVVGVDVSPSMVDLATRLNQCPQTVSYVCNQAPDLSIFKDHSFDFIVSSIVLQHVRPDLACSYIHEFFRVLRPAGIAVFQLPSHHRRAGVRPLESIVKPMPDDAYRASLLVAGIPRVMRPGGQINLQIEVTNVSMFDWIQRDYGVFGVGNHWLEGGGARMLTRDDGRTKLPATLRAGETCRLSLTINAPPKRGEYELEVDVAHEGVLWFQDRGSEVVRLAVRVGEDELDFGLAAERVSRVEPTTPPAAATDGRPVETRSLTGARMDVDDPGEFPMYGVPLNTVASLIADHGATLLHIENDRSGGEDWVSYRYFVRAAGSR
jgi:SAM-dependent methyltransferase